MDLAVTRAASHQEAVPLRQKVRWSFLVKSHFFANHQNNTKLAIDLERRMINETPAVPTATLDNKKQNDTNENDNTKK